VHVKAKPKTYTALRDLRVPRSAVISPATISVAPSDRGRHLLPNKPPSNQHARKRSSFTSTLKTHVIMASTVTINAGDSDSDSDKGVCTASGPGPTVPHSCVRAFALKTRTRIQTIEGRMKWRCWASVPVPHSRTSVPLDSRQGLGLRQ
jgi:hypothetical protein